MATICCDVDQRRFGVASAAAEWVRAFHPHVTVTVERGAAHLISEQDDDDSLRMIWRTALANEVLLARGAERRVGVIAGLVA